MKQLGIQLTPEVIDAINGELRYTESLQDLGRADGEDYGIAGQLVVLSTYTRRAIDAWSNNKGEDKTREELRKVAAIALRALIQSGVIPREGFES